jgi:hypothetical protein
LGDGDSNPAELLFHLASKYERPLIEQDMPPLAEHLGKEHGLNQAGAVIEGGEFHGLILDGVDRLGSCEHTGNEHVLSHVAMQLGTGTQAKAAQLLGMQRHGMGVGDEAKKGELFLPAALGSVILENRHGGGEVVEPVGGR